VSVCARAHARVRVFACACACVRVRVCDEVWLLLCQLSGLSCVYACVCVCVCNWAVTAMSTIGVVV